MTVLKLHFRAMMALSWAASSLVAAAESSTYRIDVIVFSNLGGSQDQRPSDLAQRFIEFPEPQANARAAAWDPLSLVSELDTEEQARLDALATLDQLRALENPEEQNSAPFQGGPTFPPHWLGLESMNPRTVDAWQRLESSPNHAPLVWRSWHQPLTPNTQGRWMRLSGGPILDLDWLKVEAVSADIVDVDVPAVFLLPETRRQLDGIIRIRQQQFMHVDIDLVWQTPTNDWMFALADDYVRSAKYLTHSLRQSRSVRTDRIEYFDSPWLGALVFIEEWQSPGDQDITRP